MFNDHKLRYSSMGIGRPVLVVMNMGEQEQSVTRGETIRLRLYVPETKGKEMVVGQSISTKRTVPR